MNYEEINIMATSFEPHEHVILVKFNPRKLVGTQEN